MTDKKCKLNFRILPEIYAIEIAKYFQLELKLGKSTQWGIGKYKMNEEDGCNHWLCAVLVGEKKYIPNICFKTRKEAEQYLERMGQLFPTVCQTLFGIGSETFSSN